MSSPNFDDSFKLLISSLLSTSFSTYPDCNYYSEHDFNISAQKIKKENSCISLFHINIRSLNANHSKLLQLLITLNFKFDVIVLSEVWAFNISMYKNILPNYNFYFKLPKDSCIGGIGVFINSSFSVNVRNDIILDCMTNNNLAESIFLELTKGNYQCIIGGIYRHPNQSIATFTSSLEAVLCSTNLIHSHCEWFLIGDLNINVLKYDSDSATTKFIDMLISYNFLPLSLLPTRITDTTSTLIDHIFYKSNVKAKYNNIENIFTGTLVTDITDHLANFVILPSPATNKNTNDRPLIRIFSPTNKKLFLDELSNCDWNSTIYANNEVNIAFA